MPLTDEVKKQIDSKSFERMVYEWRHAGFSNPVFWGESGEYWMKRMDEIRPR